MKIGVIGAGRIGSGLGKRWANAGHQVMFGSRDPEKARQVAAQVGANTSDGTLQEAAQFGDVVLLATPFDAAEETLRSLGSLQGKILIETTNNFVDQNPVSTTERIMEWAPGAKVVKGFNTVFQGILNADPASQKARPDVFMVGDDADAKKIAAQLIADAGCDAIDAGPAKNARHVDNLGRAIVEFAYGQKMGTDINFKLTKVL